MDSRIFYMQNEGGRDFKKAIELPEDLLSVEWSEARVKESGFYMDL